MNKPDEENKIIVRLSTSTWSDKRGLHTKRSLTYLRRKCKGFNLLEWDVKEGSDPDDVLYNIANFNECEDGEYELKVINIEKDWEAGYVGNWDYWLEKTNP